MSQERVPNKIGYARVSTADQNPAEQIAALVAAGVPNDPDHLFIEKASGAKADRPVRAQALAACQEGDTLVVWRLSRFGRSAEDLFSTVVALDNRSVEFESLHEHIDTHSAAGRLMLRMLAAVAEFEREIIEFEREIIVENVQAGVKAARAERGSWGPKPKVTAAKARTIALLREDGRPLAEIARTVGVSRQTLYRHLAATTASVEAL